MSDEHKGHEEVQSKAEAYLQRLEEKIDGVVAEQQEFRKDLNEAKKVPQHNYPAPFVREGESTMSSQPFSLMKLCRALKARNANVPHWANMAKTELDLGKRLGEAYNKMGWSGEFGGIAVPLGHEFIPTEETVTDDGKTIPGVPAELAKECKDIMQFGGSYDPDEYRWMAKRFPQMVTKDLSAQTATTGGVFVDFPGTGELIDVLRAVELFARAGAVELTLPPSGAIRFPRVTSSVTIAATTEGATISESTPATSGLTLTAKPYVGLVDIPDELLKFATTVSVEAWLRGEFAKEIALKADRDMVNGDGGSGIQGLTYYSGITSRTASTTGATGDTLTAWDPILLKADLAGANAPVEAGFFWATQPALWGGLQTRRDSNNNFLFSVTFNSMGPGSTTPMNLSGDPMYPTTQIPATRQKGGVATLTMLLAGVGSEYVIGRAGVVEVSMTDSDASKFASRLSTMRAVAYVDGGPKHEASFGIIDQLTNS